MRWQMALAGRLLRPEETLGSSSPLISLSVLLSRRIPSGGGRVLGSVRHPINSPDFASLLLQAQASKAKIVGLATAGGDMINLVKQSAEFGVAKGDQSLAGLLVFIADIHSLGLQAAQGMYLTAAFYWDLNDKTRAWSKKFA